VNSRLPDGKSVLERDVDYVRMGMMYSFWSLWFGIDFVGQEWLVVADIEYPDAVMPLYLPTVPTYKIAYSTLNTLLEESGNFQCQGKSLSSTVW
jgi:hypothetical protein